MITENDTKVIMQSFARIAPGYAAWRTERLSEIMAFNGTSQDVEVAAMRKGWHTALSHATSDEVLAVLEAMERGAVPIPPYGEAPRAISLEIRNRRSERKAAESVYTGERSYRCLHCHDTGIVEVLHPQWVEEYRDTFADVRAAGFPGGWFGKANSIWRRRRLGALRAVALCDCNCPATERLREQQDRFRNGERRSAPACGAERWNRSKSPRMDGTPLETLLGAWYDGTEPNSGYEWDPDPDQYGAITDE